MKVLVDAHATKVTMDGNTATGVEFLDYDGKKHQVKASKSVIASAGVIATPQLLELSGIGDPEVLKAAGVECLVENKAIGANFEDHVLGSRSKLLYRCQCTKGVQVVCSTTSRKA